MQRFAPAVVLTLCAAMSASAQDKQPAQPGLSATWHFDQSRSDTVTGNVLAGLGSGPRPLGGGGGGGAGAGAGGGGGGGGGRSRRSQPAPTTDASTAADSAQQQDQMRRMANAVRDPKTAIILEDVNPGDKLVITVTDSTAAIAGATGRQLVYRTDGRKRQQAQMDGSIIETQAQWNNGVLQLMRGVPGTGSLRRELKLNKDGTLEVKETIEVSGRKIDKKLIFTKE